MSPIIDHSALRPLSHTAKVGVIELCLPSVPSRERAEQGERRVQAYPVALCGIGHNAEPFGREVLHGLSTSWRRRTKACRFARRHSVTPSDYTVVSAERKSKEFIGGANSDVSNKRGTLVPVCHRRNGEDHPCRD